MPYTDIRLTEGERRELGCSFSQWTADGPSKTASPHRQSMADKNLAVAYDVFSSPKPFENDCSLFSGPGSLSVAHLEVLEAILPSSLSCNALCSSELPKRMPRHLMPQRQAE